MSSQTLPKKKQHFHPNDQFVNANSLYSTNDTKSINKPANKISELFNPMKVLHIRRLLGKWVPSAHISHASSRLSLCACAVTSSINWEATDAISWNSCYVCVCSYALNMFKTIEGAADCEIRSVIRFFWKLGMCCQVRFITRSVKCMVTMRWVMAWLGNGFWCSMKDERTCTMRREVGVHLWWMMIWCVRSRKECVTTDVSQFLICPALSSDFKDSMSVSVVANIAGGRILWGGYTKLVLRYVKCLNNGGEYVEK